MRTIVDLPPDQVEALAKHCKSQGISRAEAVRRAVAQLLKHEESNHREKAFGAWKQKNVDSVRLIQEMRDEWDS